MAQDQAAAPGGGCPALLRGKAPADVLFPMYGNFSSEMLGGKKIIKSSTRGPTSPRGAVPLGEGLWERLWMPDRNSKCYRSAFMELCFLVKARLVFSFPLGQGFSHNCAIFMEVSDRNRGPLPAKPWCWRSWSSGGFSL